MRRSKTVQSPNRGRVRDRGPTCASGFTGVGTIAINLEFLADGGILGVATGTLTGRDIVDAGAAIYATPEKTLASVYQIHDYRRVESIDISTADIQRMAASDNKAARLNPNIIIAVVVGNELGFGLSRMWQAYMSEYPFVSRVFRSMPEAKTWVAEQLKDEAKP